MPAEKIDSEAREAKPRKNVESFSATLAHHGLELKRDKTSTLQVNVGLLCNQTCKHCHLDAGPGRSEMMTHETAEAVEAYAGRSNFKVIDVTGGAPELNPHIEQIIQKLAPLSPRFMFRSNLAVLHDKGGRLAELLRDAGAVIVASFPSLNPSQTDTQRGKGVFEKSVDALVNLNRMGYGTDLELDLVSNPAGAFLPPAQKQAEDRFRRVLKEKWGIVFNNLFTFANTPLGRFRDWLARSGNFEGYMKKLVASFNPCAVSGVMCRTLVSVSWDGFLHDCDFNIARGLYLGGKKIHVSEMPGGPEPGTSVATADHCFSCVAGAGFT